MLTTTYLCHFTFKGKDLIVGCHDGPSAFSEGFWINASYRFTKASDCKFWIPPTAIRYVEKAKVHPLAEIGDSVAGAVPT